MEIERVATDPISVIRSRRLKRRAYAGQSQALPAPPPAGCGRLNVPSFTSAGAHSQRHATCPSRLKNLAPHPTRIFSDLDYFPDHFRVIAARCGRTISGGRVTTDLFSI